MGYFLISQADSADLYRTRRANNDKSRSQIISEANQFLDKHLPTLAGNDGKSDEFEDSEEQYDKEDMESWSRLQKMFEFTEKYPGLEEKIVSVSKID